MLGLNAIFGQLDVEVFNPFYCTLCTIPNFKAHRPKGNVQRFAALSLAPLDCCPDDAYGPSQSPQDPCGNPQLFAGFRQPCQSTARASVGTEWAC